MAEFFFAGSTSQTISIWVPDSSSTTGGGLSGLAYNTSGLTCYYRKGATGTSTAVTLATQTVGGAWSSGGFVEVDATNMKGLYRFDVPNALIDTAGLTHVVFRGAANMAPVVLRLDCRAVPGDVKLIAAQTASASGTVTFPNATLASTTNITAGTITTTTNLTNLPTIPSNWLTAAGIAANALDDKGNWLQPTTAGRKLDVSTGGEAGIDWANIGSPTTTVNLSGTTVKTSTDILEALGDGTVVVGSIMDNVITASSVAASALDGKGNWNIGKTGYSLTATTGLGNQTADITGNLSGSVGSVTGNVGGSVASVTGAVGSVTGNVGGSVASVTGGVTLANGAHGGASASITLSDYSNFTGAAAASPDLMQSTTLATVTSQTSMTLTAGSADDDAYNNAIAVFTDQSTSTQTAFARITDYVGSTKTVTLESAPAFTVASGDTIKIIAFVTTDAVIAPIQSQSVDRVSGDTLKAFVGEDYNFTVYPVDAAGTAVDVSGLTLEITIEDHRKTDVQVIADGSITKTSTYYRFTTSSSSANAAEMLGKWACRRIDTGNVIGHGPYIVTYAADSD